MLIAGNWKMFKTPAETAEFCFGLKRRLPELDGVETTARMRSVCPDASVVVLTAGVETGELAALYDAGAVACLTKDSNLNEIVGAIRQAAGATVSHPPAAA